MDGIRVLWKTLDVEKIISEAFMEKVTFKARPWKLNGVFWDICKLKELWGEVDTQHPWHIWGGQERAYHSQWMQFMEYILVDSWAISGLAVVPNLWDLMPDDLRWRWCNNNRNKVHSRSFQNYPLAVHGKVVFHKTGPWCQKVGDHCFREHGHLKWVMWTESCQEVMIMFQEKKEEWVSVSSSRDASPGSSICANEWRANCRVVHDHSISDPPTTTGS